VALDIITWIWGTKYTTLDIRKLYSGVKKHLKQPFTFNVFTQGPLVGLPTEIVVRPIADPVLTQRHCFCRLRQFHPRWQEANGFRGRIISLDLDAVITGPLDPLFDRPEDFLILQGVNSNNPNPFNGSVTMLRAGKHPEVWDDFSVEKARKTPFYEFPDDQGWIWHKLPNASGWKGGSPSGIYAFQKPGWPAGLVFPTDARIVAFIGAKKPSMYRHLGWVQRHWREH